MKRILVTGASGFIGSHISEYFCKKNEQLICLIRPESDVSYIKTLPVVIRQGDIRNRTDMEKIMSDIDVVIHTAALVGDWGDYQDFYETNVSGTMNVLEAGLKNGINQFIITGSISSYGEENANYVKNEKDKYNSHYPYFMDSFFPCGMNHYRDTKAQATRMAIEIAKHNNTNLTILEPVWVYGEREWHSGFYEYMKLVKDRCPFFPGSLKNKFHVIYARDLARAYYLAYRSNIEGIHRYIIGNTKRDYMDHVYGLFCRELNVGKPLKIPKSIIYPFAMILELIYMLLGKRHAPILTRGRVNMFYDNIEYDTRKARKALAFINEFSIEEGVKQTVSWYKKMHLI